MGKKLRPFTARGEIKAGKLVLDSPRFLKGMVQQFADCKVNVTISPRAKRKSKEQQGYLWGVVYPYMTEHTGHTPEELHEIFKVKFLRKKRLWRGAEMVVVGSTESLTSGEMAEFITNVVREAADMGIAVPDPDKLYQFK